MNILNNFRTFNFIKKMKVLNQIEKESNINAIDELFELYEKPLNDVSIDSTIIQILRTLLGFSENNTIKGLNSSIPKIKKLCISIAGEKRFKSTGPILKEFSKKESNEEILLEILLSLSTFRTPEYLEVFQDNLLHPEEKISALCIEMVEIYKDYTSINTLFKIIENAELEKNCASSNIIIRCSIETLNSFKTDKVTEFLISKIHHKNPIARRLIQKQIINIGEQVIPFIVSIFDQENNDKKISGAYILGLLGNKKGGKILISALDNPLNIDTNVKYAIYEALGNFSSLEGKVCLVDVLQEEDEMLLMAIIFSLNKQINIGIIKKIKELIIVNDSHSEKILKIIVYSTSLNIFEALYEDDIISRKLFKIIKSCNKELASEYIRKLNSFDNGKARIDIENLSKNSSIIKGKKIVAVDDSKAMLHFYRSIASDMGMPITTAENGVEAFKLLKKSKEVDIIIVDMNMPIINGIEFTQKVRNHARLKKIPIIMITTETEKSQKELAIKVGVTTFLNKPFDQEILKKEIESILSSEPNQLSAAA